MPDEIAHELHWALARSVLHAAGLPDDCDSCRGTRICSDPVTLSAEGDLLGYDLPGALRWPRCPGSYACLRQVGQDARPLDEALAWLVERGVHRHPDLGSGAAMMYREYIANRTIGRSLLKARSYAEIRRKRGQP